MGWLGIAPYLKLQWAAVTTQYWLIKEPPQKWDPVVVWGGKRGEELGLGGLNTPKLGTDRGPLTASWPCQCLGHCPGRGTVLYLQGHLPGPGAGHSVLPIDNPLAVGHRGTDGGHPAA